VVVAASGVIDGRERGRITSAAVRADVVEGSRR